MNWNMMDMMGGGMMPGMMMFGWLMMLLFAALVIAALVYLIRALSQPGKGRGRSLEIARERYARGEIDEYEFEELRRNLED